MLYILFFTLTFEAICGPCLSTVCINCREEELICLRCRIDASLSKALLVEWHLIPTPYEYRPLEPLPVAKQTKTSKTSKTSAAWLQDCPL